MFPMWANNQETVTLKKMQDLNINESLANPKQETQHQDWQVSLTQSPVPQKLACFYLRNQAGVNSSHSQLN